MTAKFPNPWFVIFPLFPTTLGYLLPSRTRKSAMEDSGEDMEVLTRALVETIKQLAEPSPTLDQKDALEKTTTGVFLDFNVRFFFVEKYDTESSRLRSLLLNFIVNMSSWQKRIEHKLSAIQQAYKGQTQANINTIDVFQEYEDKDKFSDTSMPG